MRGAGDRFPRRTLMGAALGIRRAAWFGSIVSTSLAIVLLAAAAAAIGGAWSEAAPMPAARAEVGAAVLGDRVVVVGGLDAGGHSLDRVESYDPVSDAWTTLASLPGPRDHMAVAEWDGRLYVSGGGEFARRMAHPNLWVYDSESDTWSSLASMPAARWQHAMVVIDGVIHVVGGIIDGSADHAEVWAYDIATDTWRTDLAPLPTPREHLAAVATDGMLVALAGRMGSNLATVEIYDPGADTWSSGPEMPTPRSGFAAAVLPDGVHVTGGEDFGTRRTIATHEVLDLGSMRWTTSSELPTARHGTASAVIDGHWYVIGGAPQVGLSTSDIAEVWKPS